MLRFVNTPPSLSQISYIRSLIASGEAEHAMLARVISELTSKQDQISADLVKWRQVLCPIRRIPPELLAEIFSYFMAPLKKTKHAWDLNGLPRATPLVLTHVCAVWRRVAFDTPRLWTRLKFCFLSTEVTDHSIATLRGFLSHSQPHPIDLKVAVQENYVLNLDRLLEGLIPSFSRLKNLELDMRWDGYNPLCGRFPSSMSMPLLESVDVQGFGDPLSIKRTDVYKMPRPIFSNAPCLRKATLWDREQAELTKKPSELLKILALPWPQLTELSMGDIFISAADAKTLLRQCTALEKCDLDRVPCWRPGEDPLLFTNIAVFPALREFDIKLDYENSSRSRGGVFFQDFHMPMLRKLYVNAEYGANMPVDDDTDFLMFLFNPSGSHITHLTLNCVHFAGAAILELFQFTPELVYFHSELCGVALYDWTFEALTYRGPNGPPPLVPHLETLWIEEFGELDLVTADAIMDMIRSRWWSDEEYKTLSPPVARLKKVYITWDTDGERLEMDEEQEAELELWQEEGLDVSF